MIVGLDNIEIGKDVNIGSNVVIVDQDHDYKGNDRNHAFTTSPKYIGDNICGGANTVIMRGAKIGASSVIGTGRAVKGAYSEDTLIF